MSSLYFHVRLDLIIAFCFIFQHHFVFSSRRTITLIGYVTRVSDFTSKLPGMGSHTGLISSRCPQTSCPAQTNAQYKSKGTQRRAPARATLHRVSCSLVSFRSDAKRTLWLSVCYRTSPVCGTCFRLNIRHCLYYFDWCYVTMYSFCWRWVDVERLWKCWRWGWMNWNSMSNSIIMNNCSYN